MARAHSDRRRREVFTLVALTVLGGGGIFLYLLLLTGWLTLAVLATAAGVAVLACLHYLLWGWAAKREGRHIPGR
jgi:hypothetical protein